MHLKRVTKRSLTMRVIAGRVQDHREYSAADFAAPRSGPAPPALCALTCAQRSSQRRRRCAVSFVLGIFCANFRRGASRCSRTQECHGLLFCERSATARRQQGGRVG